MHGNGEKPVESEAADPALAATGRPASALPEPEPAAAFGPTVAAADGTLNVTATDAATPRARARLTGLAGRRLAHYRIEEEIGRGGMGVVYLARDLALDRPVAIKVLSGEFTPPSEERFYREARAQARVNHPNVCHIYYVGEEVGEASDLLFFAMEFIDGQSVAELIEQEGKLPVPRALEIVRQAAHGLREARKHGIVHRDVKPSNLMIDPHGVVKVMDFGIAKQADNGDTDAAEIGPVEQTSIAGTPLYAAPEQLRGDAIDHRADVYALGATLHQMLSGSAPFSADSADELTDLHQTATRPEFAQETIGRRDVSLLNELVDRMMAKSPVDRFESYDDLLSVIEFAEPTTSRPAKFGVRTVAAVVDVGVSSLIAALFSLILPFNEIAIVIIVWPTYLIALQSRLGTTAGRWLVGIEVTVPGRRTGIGIKAATARTLWEVGPVLLAFALLELGDQVVHSQIVAVLFLVALIAAVALNVVHVAVVSWRTPSARTFWDHRAGTQVRYLSASGVASARGPSSDSTP